MRIPRRELVENNSNVHMYWRCHNKSMLLRPAIVKDLLLKLYFKEAPKFGIGIVEHQILDNHAHFIVNTPSANALGGFARKVHTKMAIFINKYFRRDSQVFRDRFCSPMVDSPAYFVDLIQYVWLNRLKINPKIKPAQDRYCSAYHRLRNTSHGKKLMSYSEAGLCTKRDEKSFFNKLLKDCVDNFREKLLVLKEETFENKYFIGSATQRGKFKQKLRALMEKMRAKRQASQGI